MITRRFWPLVGGAETLMSNLAVEFQRLGASPTIVTAQWHADWPTQMWCRETPVVRLPSPKSRGFGTVRYMHALSRWLKRHRSEYDAICVSRLRHDAYAAVTALAGGSTPIILRNEDGGETGDCAWLEQVRFGRRMWRSMQSAHAIVAPSPEIVDEISQAGFDETRIQAIPNGVELAPSSMTESSRLAQKLQARRELGEANRDLAIHPTDPLAVYVGALHPSRRLLDVVRAFRHVVEADRNAGLWLIGDGPQRESLYREIVDRGLHHNILMPGCFDDVSEILQAADLYLSPSDETSAPHAMLQAMSHGLPVIAADIAGNRQVLQHNVNGWLTPPRSVAALAEAITFLSGHPAHATRLGAAAQRAIASNFTIAQTAKAHLQLMESLMTEAPKDSSTSRRKQGVGTASM